jgi:hypothetical protein
MTASTDFLNYNRAAVAAAYRRLADAALHAADVFTDPDLVPEEQPARRAVLDRVESVEHALAVVAATRHGIAKGRRAA